MHFVYILQCSDDSYYVGSTQNVLQRLDVHLSGNGPVFTSRRLPVQLVYQEPYATLEEAVRREKQLKGWTRKRKLDLIRTLNPLIIDLSEGWLVDEKNSEALEAKDQILR